MYEDAPPLKVWAYAAVVVFSFAFLFLSYCYAWFGPYAKVLEKCKSSLEEALIEINARDTSAISVVILGSSLTERALLDPNEIAEHISQQTKKKTKVLRFALYYLNMDLAESIDFFGYVCKHPPTYLIIENFGINLEDNDTTTSTPVPIDATLLSLRNQFRQALGLSLHDNYYAKWYTFDSKPLPGHEFYTDQFDSVTFKSLQTKKNLVRKVSENAVANNAYEALVKSKTKIVFLDMPISDKLLTNFLDQKGTSELNNVLEYYQQQYNIEYWKYPTVMNDSCFMDGIHLNYKGARNIRTGSLLNSLQQNNMKLLIEVILFSIPMVLLSWTLPKRYVLLSQIIITGIFIFYKSPLSF